MCQRAPAQNVYPYVGRSAVAAAASSNAWLMTWLSFRFPHAIAQISVFPWKNESIYDLYFVFPSRTNEVIFVYFVDALGVLVFPRVARLPR